jgi:hypothetical protein
LASTCEAKHGLAELVQDVAELPDIGLRKDSRMIAIGLR